MARDLYLHNRSTGKRVIYDRGYVTASRSRPPRRCVARLRVIECPPLLLDRGTMGFEGGRGLKDKIGNLGMCLRLDVVGSIGFFV